MGNNVGKIWLLLLMSPVLSAETMQMVLRARSAQGDALQHAVVGEPFILEVVISGSSSVQRPHVDGLSAFTVRSSGVMTYTANQATTTTYQYSVRIDTPGTYSIGPAHLEAEGNRLSSSMLTINVLDQNAQEVQKQRSRENADPAMVRLFFDTDHAVVGQKVTCTLQLCSVANKASFEQMFEPDFQYFRIGDKKGPIQKNEEINGVHYQMHEWVWTLYPTKTGKLVIPAVPADYGVQTRGHGFSFFVYHPERRRAYSSAAFLTVEPLPTSEKICAVGRFYQMQAHITPSIAAVQEGMVLTLEIIGDGDFENAPFPDLIGMPAALRWYTSKRTVGDSQKEGMRTVVYEYIVQGMKAGQWTIPAQEIVVFDVAAGRVKKMETVPLSVTVTAARGAKQEQNSVQAQSNNEKMNAASGQESEEWSLPLHAWDGGSGGNTSWHMPWMLFFLCILLAGVCSVRSFALRLVTVIYSIVRVPLKKQRLNAAIEKACAENDPARVYHLFMDFLTQEMEIIPSCLSDAVIEQYVQHIGITGKEKQEWDDFWVQLHAAAFARLDEASMNVLCMQAKQWITRIKRSR